MNENDSTGVTRVTIETDGDGAEVTITVSRVPEPCRLAGAPSVNDVPPDVRAALGDWLYPDDDTERETA